MKKLNNTFTWVAGTALFLAAVWPKKSRGINMPGLDKNDKLSYWFDWSEVEQTNTGIDNTLPPHLYGNAILLAQEVLDPIRNDIELPLYVNSWYRSEAVNEAVGGSEESKHLEALAADIDTGNNELNAAIMRSAISQNLPFDQLIAYDSWNEPSRVHIDYGGDNPRRQVGLKANGRYTWITLADATQRYL